MWKVTRQTKKSLPILIEALKEGTGTVQETAIRLINQMGPEAKELIQPDLKELVDEGPQKREGMVSNIPGGVYRRWPPLPFREEAE